MDKELKATQIANEMGLHLELLSNKIGTEVEAVAVPMVKEHGKTWGVMLKPLDDAHNMVPTLCVDKLPDFSTKKELDEIAGKAARMLIEGFRNVETSKVMEKIKNISPEDLEYCVSEKEPEGALCEKLECGLYGYVRAILGKGKDIATTIIKEDNCKALLSSMSAEEIFAYAKSNTAKKAVVMDMEKMLFCTSMPTKISVDDLDSIELGAMIALSTTDDIYGAGIIGCPWVFKKIANRLNSDLCILPSSKHELVIIPYDKTISVDALLEMNRSVNGEVSEEDYLCTAVFQYTRDTDKVILAVKG